MPSKTQTVTAPCGCGCGATITTPKLFPSEIKFRGSVRFIKGHQHRGRKHTPEHIAKTTHAMEKNPRWKGGIMRDSDGYVLLKRPDHPFATRAGYVREHRLVAEQMVGRPLLRHELVHHINGIKHDNRPSNLQVVDHVTHQRIERIGKKFPRATTQILTCATCGKTFHRQRSYGPSKFCSWACRYPSVHAEITSVSRSHE